jgi:hypothetical protein
MMIAMWRGIRAGGMEERGFTERSIAEGRRAAEEGFEGGVRIKIRIRIMN